MAPSGTQVGQPRWDQDGSHVGPTWDQCGVCVGFCVGVGVGPIWAGPDGDDVGYITVGRNSERRLESGCLGRKGRVEIHGRQTVDGIP